MQQEQSSSIKKLHYGKEKLLNSEWRIRTEQLWKSLLSSGEGLEQQTSAPAWLQDNLIKVQLSFNISRLEFQLCVILLN